jgi:hypothetical protein
MRTITGRVQLKKENTGRGSQGACRQDEQIGETATLKVILTNNLVLGTDWA